MWIYDYFKIKSFSKHVWFTKIKYSDTWEDSWLTLAFLSFGGCLKQRFPSNISNLKFLLTLHSLICNWVLVTTFISCEISVKSAKHLVFLMDFTVKISLSIYGIASLNFFFLFIHLFFFAFLALKNSAVLGGGHTGKKNRPLRSWEQGLGMRRNYSSLHLWLEYLVDGWML